MSERMLTLVRHCTAASALPVDDGNIQVEKTGHILHIIIDRPHKYNGFTPNMFVKIAKAFTQMENDMDVRVGILSANGKHFSAGLDMAQVTFDARLFPVGEVDPAGLYPPKRTKPLICVCHGVTFTVGLELALAADIVVAAKGTRFAQVEVKRGTMSFLGGTFRLIERAGYGTAMRYLLTGDEFNEQQGASMGVVQEIADTKEAALALGMQLARRISEQAPLGVQQTLKSAQIAMSAGIDTAVNALGGQVRYLSNSKDFAEGVRSFKEKRRAVYEGK